jgi:small subunit ribosomal protein S20
MRDSPVARAKIAVLTPIRRRFGAAFTAVVSVDTRIAIVGPRCGGTPAALVCFMANIHSQKKRIQRAERERLENRRYTSRVKTYFRRLEAAVASGDDTTAETEHRELVATIDKAVKRGALHRNTGARKKSRAARIRRGA